MSEWAVVGVIVTLIGLVVTVTTPVIKLNKTITRLEVLLDNMRETHKEDKEELEKELLSFKDENSDSHRRIHEKVDKNTARIECHDKDILLLKERTENKEK